MLTAGHLWNDRNLVAQRNYCANAKIKAISLLHMALGHPSLWLAIHWPEIPRRKVIGYYIIFLLPIVGYVFSGNCLLPFLGYFL